MLNGHNAVWSLSVMITRTKGGKVKKQITKYSVNVDVKRMKGQYIGKEWGCSCNTVYDLTPNHSN